MADDASAGPMGIRLLAMQSRSSLDFLSVFKGKSDGLLTCFKLKDPGAVPELIAVMELGIVRGSIHPHL
jgi:hypothetical protein